MPSRHLETSIDIDAPRRRVWEVLTAYGRYPAWNPLIPRIQAEASDVDFHIVLGAFPVPVASSVARADAPSELVWEGPRSSAQRSLFRGEHYFRLEELDTGTTRFIHGERFAGAALPLLWWWLEPRLRGGYERMNAALKTEAEA